MHGDWKKNLVSEKKLMGHLELKLLIKYQVARPTKSKHWITVGFLQRREITRRRAPTREMKFIVTCMWRGNNWSIFVVSRGWHHLLSAIICYLFSQSNTTSGTWRRKTRWSGKRHWKNAIRYLFWLAWFHILGKSSNKTVRVSTLGGDQFQYLLSNTLYMW